MYQFAIPPWAKSKKMLIIEVYSVERSVPKTASKLGLSTSWTREVIREYKKFLQLNDAHNVTRT